MTRKFRKGSEDYQVATATPDTTREATTKWVIVTPQSAWLMQTRTTAVDHSTEFLSIGLKLLEGSSGIEPCQYMQTRQTGESAEKSPPLTPLLRSAAETTLSAAYQQSDLAENRDCMDSRRFGPIRTFSLQSGCLEE